MREVVFISVLLLSLGAYAQNAEHKLKKALQNPEYMLQHWVQLPTYHASKVTPLRLLTPRDAILLALRYNPSIQGAELDRVVQRYQLRIAENAFELQYAFAGSFALSNSRYDGVGTVHTQNLVASPELRYRNTLGTQLSVTLENNLSSYNNFTPVLRASFSQPLLEGFGKAVNEANLLQAKDQEYLNKIQLKQAIMDKVTLVVETYRHVIVSRNNWENQQRQLTEAENTYAINEKKIHAGQLEPTANVQQSYQIESLRLSQEQAKNEYEISVLHLLQEIGLDPDTRLRVLGNIDVMRPKTPSLQTSLALARANNTQLQALKMQVRADKRAYLIAKNQQMWRLDVGASIESGVVTNVSPQNHGIAAIFNGRNTATSANLKLIVPIRDLTKRGEVIRAKIALEKDKIALLAFTRSLTTTITNIIRTIQSQEKQVMLAEKRVALAIQSYELEKKKWQAGIATGLDVNNTQNQLIMAQTGLIAAKASYLNQVSSLQRIVGTTLQEWQIPYRYEL